MDGDVQTTTQGRALSPVDHFKAQLDRMGTQFQAVLPPHITVDRFKRVVLTAIQNNPDLLAADQRSLWNACMKAATDGLEPDGRYAALVIFSGKQGKIVQYMPMVAGVLRRARNSGEIGYMNAHVVYENDALDHWIDDKGEHFKHTPNWRGGRGQVLAVYAIARDKDGETYVEVMSHKQVEAVRAVSRAKEAGPWTQWWDEMARKTALRRLSKKLPASAAVEETLSHDDWMHEPKQLAAPVIDATAERAEPEQPKARGRSRKKLDEFAGQGAEPADEQNGGPAGDSGPAAEEPPPTENTGAREGQQSPAGQAAAPTASKPAKAAAEKIPVAQRRFQHATGGPFDQFDAAMREGHGDAASAREITALWINHQVALGEMERREPARHAALIQHRDDRIDALRG